MNYTWTTRDGRKLDVDTITDVNHLRNIIKMMMRNEKRLLDAVNKSNNRRPLLLMNADDQYPTPMNGDMATFFNEESWHSEFGEEDEKYNH